MDRVFFPSSGNKSKYAGPIGQLSWSLKVLHVTSGVTDQDKRVMSPKGTYQPTYLILGPLGRPSGCLFPIPSFVLSISAPVNHPLILSLAIPTLLLLRGRTIHVLPRGDQCLRITAKMDACQPKQGQKRNPWGAGAP